MQSLPNYPIVEIVQKAATFILTIRAVGISEQECHREAWSGLSLPCGGAPDSGAPLIFVPDPAPGLANIQVRIDSRGDIHALSPNEMHLLFI